MKRIWKSLGVLCKWGALLLCAILVVQALPIGPLFSSDAAAPPMTEGTGVSDSANTAPETLLTLVNREREARGLLPLSAFPNLSSAATVRARELSSHFSHTRPNGKTGFTVLDAYNIPYGNAAENLAVGYIDTTALLAAWMESEAHRENILGDYTHVGIGYAKQGDVVGWVLLFVGGCEAHTVSVSGHTTDIPKGSKLSEANLTLHVNCTPHNTASLPLTDGVCTGYNREVTGRQVVTVRYGNAVAHLTINDSAPTDRPFVDVPPTAWYADAIYQLVDRGILSGTSPTTFSPDGTVTRGMLMTMLGRMANIDTSAYSKSSFSDVKVGTWYAPYVQWAYESGIATGVGGGKFSPDTTITREQLCVFLVRFAAANEIPLPTNGSDAFTDSARIGSWAKDAVSMAANAKLVGGYADGTFRPQAAATRGETAATLAKLLALL